MRTRYTPLVSLCLLGLLAACAVERFAFECEAADGVTCHTGVDDSENITPDLSRDDGNLAASGRFTLTDSNQKIESAGAAANDVPVYRQDFSPDDSDVPDLVRRHARVRTVRVDVDIDYARADAVGIWLTNDSFEGEQIIRMPRYAGESASSFTQSFATNAFSGAPAFGGWKIVIGGTQYAIDRDCYNVTTETRIEGSSQSSRSVLWGLYRSAQASGFASSERRETHACNYFFNPLHVRGLRIVVDYTVPPFPAPRVAWSIPIGIARIGTTFVHETEDDPELPALIVRPVVVSMKLRLQRTTPVRLFLVPPGCATDSCRIGLLGTDQRSPRTSLTYGEDGTARLLHSIAFPAGTTIAGQWQMRVECDVYRTVCDSATTESLRNFAILDGLVQFNGGR